VGTLVLIYDHPDLGEQRFELKPGRRYRLGKRPDNDIVIPQNDVSRDHAVLYVHPDGVRITDLGSKNGTYVNGHPVVSAVVRCGDRIALSSAELLLAETSSGTFRVSEEIEPVMERREARRPSSASETYQHQRHAGPEVFVELLERASGDRASSAAALLTWITEAFGVPGALVIASGPRGEKAVVCSAGRVEAMLGELGELDEVVRRVADPSASDPRGAGEVAIGDRLVGLRLDHDHTLVLGAAAGTLSALELRAVRAAMRNILGTAQARTVEPIARAHAAGGLPVPIVGNSRALVAAVRKAREYAQLGEPVMILGESGVGKELFAQLIHRWSSRAEGPFVAVNCAAVPEDLIEAELFGVAPGAATGVSERLGKFAAARGGTLFLDEIGDFPLALQGKLLRVLENHEYFRVGEDAPRRADARIVAATNRDLAEEVRQGRFRADLYYRLDVLPLEIPPLRRRREDIPALVNHFLATEAPKLGRRVGGCTVRALDALTRYPWPGNVRELRSEVIRMLAQVADGAVIDVDHLSPRIVSSDPVASPPVDPSPLLGLPLEEAVAEFERAFVGAVLEACGGNRTRAARRLGMTRAGLFKKLRRLGIEASGDDSTG